jgi:hypothetical protein
VWDLESRRPAFVFFFVGVQAPEMKVRMMLLSPRKVIVAVLMLNCLLFGGRSVALASTNVTLGTAANVLATAKPGAAVSHGGIDQWGDAYSSALLGTSVSWAGVGFTLGTAGALNAGSGSTVSLPAGKYSQLYMLAAAVSGNQANQNFVVTYTDGTTSTFTQSVSDWFTPQNYAGESKVLTEAYRLLPSGANQAGPFYVYGYSFAINNAKTVKSVTLPRNRGVVVLAVSLVGSGSTTGPVGPITPVVTNVSIAAAANVAGIGTPGSAPSRGGMDQWGDAYSSALLGSWATWAGVAFNLGQPGALDAASGSTVSLPAGNYSQLYMLAAAVNGNQANQPFVVSYTDGTTSTFTQNMSDWFTPQSYVGESKALTQAYRLRSSGANQTGPYYVYGYSFAINGTKVVKSVALPKNRGVVVLALSLAPVGSTTSVPPTPVVSIPATPANLVGLAGNAKVTLTWAASTGATSYHVKRATTSGGPYAQVGVPTATSYTDGSVTNGTTYYYSVSALDSAGESANSTQVSARPTAPPVGVTPPPVVTPPPTSTPPASGSNPTPVAGNCGMVLGSAAVFCDTFDAPAGTGTRSGDLDGDVWGVSRAIGDGVNYGQKWYNLWNPVTIHKCDGTSPTVLPPKDVIICNGQLREAVNDNNSGVFDAGTVTTLAMYPKQPFDFAGRTGTVSFDVSDDGGPHGAWPEFWMSDLPVPTPFNHADSWQALPANGFGIRLNNVAPIGQQGECPNQNNPDKIRWTVDSASVIRNYVLDDTLGFGTRSAMNVTYLDCVIASSGPGEFNHVELRISQNQIDVYATDAGVAANAKTLRHIAVVTNANLTLTRGLIWLEDAHYNGDKIQDQTRPSERQHTFSWDNVAFDGPFTYRDFAFDALDNTVPGPNGAISLGKFSLGNQTTSWNVSGLPANPSATAARVLFNFFQADRTTVVNVTVNGHAHSVPWPSMAMPYPTWRTFAVTIPVTDLVAGTNTVLLGTDSANVFSNVDIVLVNVTGGVPVLPGSNNAYPH